MMKKRMMPIAVGLKIKLPAIFQRTSRASVVLFITGISIETQGGQVNDCWRRCLQPGSKLVQDQGQTCSREEPRCCSLRRRLVYALLRHRTCHQDLLRIWFALRGVGLVVLYSLQGRLSGVLEDRSTIGLLDGIRTRPDSVTVSNANRYTTSNICCPAWTRTMNNASKGHCVTNYTTGQ